MKSGEGIMKTWIFVSLFAVAGVALGFGATVKEFGWITQKPKSLFKNPELKDVPRSRPPPPNPPKTKEEPSPKFLPIEGPQPKAVISEKQFDFGRIDSSTEGYHEFVITNEGEAPLELALGKTSCSCTLSELSVRTVMPGKSVKIRIKLKPKRKKGPFREWAIIKTNDRTNRENKFWIQGEVLGLLRAEPRRFNFGDVVFHETKTVEIKLLSYVKNVDQLEIQEHSFVNKTLAPFFKVRIKPLAADQLGDPRATSGCLIALTVDPHQEGGSLMPVGYIRQSLRVQTNIPGETKPTTIGINGTVRSDLFISGNSFNPVTSVLIFGSGLMNSKQVEKFLDISAQGPYRDKMKLNITSVTPKWIVTELQESQFKNSKFKQFRLLVAIPESSPAANFQGPDKEKMGKIVIETTHPDIKTLEIYLNFSVVEDPAQKEKKKIEANKKVDEKGVKKQNNKDQSKDAENKDQEAPETNRKDPPDNNSPKRQPKIKLKPKRPKKKTKLTRKTKE